MSVLNIPTQLPSKASCSQRGMSLIELIVGVAIAMIATLVIISAFSMSEVNKRNVTGAGDAAQSGNVLSRYLKRTIEEAGSALTTPDPGLFGCRMNVRIGGNVMFPNVAALAAPFGAVPLDLRVAPVVAISGGVTNRDTLIVMAGRPTASTQDYPAQYNTMLSIKSPPALGFAPNDYLLSYEIPTGANALDCYTLRVSSTFVPTPLGVAVPTLGTARPIGLAATDVPLAVGFNTPPTTWPIFLVRNLGQAPSLIALAVDANDTLHALDLLGATRTTQVIAENVVALKVRYGIDSNNDDVVDAWVDPVGAWAVGAILDGTQANAARLRQIQALRVAYVTRSSQMASSDAVNTALTVFADQSPVSINMPVIDGGRFQYQVYDLTIPLPNVRALQ